MNINVFCNINMKGVYLFPPINLKGSNSNPYIANFQSVLKARYSLLFPIKRKFEFSGLSLLLSSFKADYFIVNWIESVMLSNHKVLQYLFTILGFHILKYRRGKIIWMFHNIHPHEGENKYSKSIQNFLYRKSDLIISHSKEAADFVKTKSQTEILYKCHPITKINVTEKVEVSFCDILIWGTILPYKGVLEFISKSFVRNSQWAIHIIGICKDKQLENDIKGLCNANIKYENRHIGFNELYYKIQNCKYVLFPYIGDCVSSSGALIDTIVLGGTPVGPNRGAFKDLSEEQLCLTYQNDEELSNVLNQNITINSEKRQKFINENSWDAFGKFLYEKLNRL